MHRRYGELQAALQRAGSVEEMAAAMKDLQQFERRGRHSGQRIGPVASISGNDPGSKNGTASVPLASRSVNGDPWPG